MINALLELTRSLTLILVATLGCTVRTGKFRVGDEERGEKRADEVHDNFALWVNRFLANELNAKQ